MEFAQTGNPMLRRTAFAGLCRRLLACLLFTPVVVSTTLSAAENIATPGDSNSWLIVENAITRGDKTTVFFLTRPDMRDPNAGQPCALNYYSVTLTAGLPPATPRLEAEGVCGGSFQKSRLLDNGDVLIIVRDRLELWRGGEQVSSKRFSSIDEISKLGISTDMTGGQFYDIAPNGHAVIVVAAGQDVNEYAGSKIVAAGLAPGGKRRWEARFDDNGQFDTVEQVWAGSDGSALLQINSLASGLSAEAETQLHYIRPDGTKTLHRLNKTEAPTDFQSMTNLSGEDLQKLLQSQGGPDAESIKSLGAAPNKTGGFDVLFQRKGGADREGFFLYRLGPNGSLQSQTALGRHIEMHGLDNWVDFLVDGDSLVLLSRAAVTQKVVRSVKKRWGQNIVSWVDLDTGIPRPYLLPLDQRYLEAAMNAGDEGQQYLDGQPGSEPVLLTMLGNKPLVVSVGWVAKRQVVRLHEADQDLMAFTEVFDERQARQTKEDRRQQRKAGARASAPAAPRQQEIPQDMNAQIAGAMAQAQREIASDPNMTPEMREQMAALLAQMGQYSGAQGASLPTEELHLDGRQKGLVRYDSQPRRPMTLLIFERSTGRELLKKDYPTGLIEEYIDFGQFGLPLDQIGVNYRDITGTVVRDLAPVAGP